MGGRTPLYIDKEYQELVHQDFLQYDSRVKEADPDGLCARASCRNADLT